MARYTCQRCGAECNTTNDPHLCVDLKKRYERQAKAVEIVTTILKKHLTQHFVIDTLAIHYDEIAMDIVKALSGRDLGVD